MGEQVQQTAQLCQNKLRISQFTHKKSPHFMGCEGIFTAFILWECGLVVCSWGRGPFSP